MRAFTATITKRGQVTIPAGVQRELGLHPGDRVRFIVEEGRVHLVPTEFTIETVFGSVEPLPGFANDIDFEEQISAAKDDRAERLTKDLNTS